MEEPTHAYSFPQGHYVYTIAVKKILDRPLTCVLGVSRSHRSHGGSAQHEDLGKRTYEFEEIIYGNAGLEADVLLLALLDYMKAAFLRGEQLPCELPVDWMTRR